jgi:hypothetical protein
MISSPGVTGLDASGAAAEATSADRDAPSTNALFTVFIAESRPQKADGVTISPTAHPVRDVDTHIPELVYTQHGI